MQIKFIILGEPQGKGRPRFYRGHACTPTKTVVYEKGIQAACNTVYPDTRFADNDLLSFQVTAYCKIPKSVNKRKRGLMAKGIIRPRKKPDGDNILKVVADALNGIAYQDDVQLVDMQVRKFYGDEPRVEVRIAAVGDEL